MRKRGQTGYTATAVLPSGRNFGRKAQKGRKKVCGAGKISGRIFSRIIKKGPKRGRIFMGLSFSKNHVDFLAKTIIIKWFVEFFLCDTGP
jgi:hypothetical protein